MEKNLFYNSSEPVTLKDVEFVCYYFGAKWDHKSVDFTPVLASFYDEANK